MTEQDLSENYKGAFGKRIGFGKKPALIMIDFVEAYFDPACSLYAGTESALESGLRLQAVAREVGVPVLYTNVVYNKTALNGGRFYQKSMTLHHFLEGSPMGAWPKGLMPAEDELVISKQYASAFFGTSLASTLTSLGIDTQIHTGVSTSGCIRATCVDCNSHGFRSSCVTRLAIVTRPRMKPIFSTWTPNMATSSRKPKPFHISKI
jgi:maleamate amidohydrolase